MNAQNRSAQQRHEQIHAQATMLAGPPGNLCKRAVQYHHIYRASGGIFCFALIAAHGAVWAQWYLKIAWVGAVVLAAVDRRAPGSFRTRMMHFNAYTGALKDINRRVMIKAYTVLHFAKDGMDDDALVDDLPSEIVLEIRRLLAKQMAGEPATNAEKRALYEAFFRWEQENAVGPSVETAMAAFDWPLMRNLCLRPWVWFSYFRAGRSLNFKDFTSAEERVDKGLAAFDIAMLKGWDNVDKSLRRNPFVRRLTKP
ncbi:MAG: hypothetical protein ACSHWS_12165 [Sulfitobacter sp.]